MLSNLYSWCCFVKLRINPYTLMSESEVRGISVDIVHSISEVPGARGNSNQLEGRAAVRMAPGHEA
jgi:hypothetical protein